MTREQIIEDITEDWARQFIADIRTAAQKLSKDTGTGAESFDAQVEKASGAAAAVVITDFAEYLRLFDMRSLKREKNFTPAAMERIRKWIERKGVSNFMKKYKYPTEVRKKGQLVSVPTTRIINNIAWGISAAKRRAKRVRWYNQKKGSDLYKLYAALVNGVTTHALSEIAAHYNDGNSPT